MKDENNEVLCGIDKVAQECEFDQKVIYTEDEKKVAFPVKFVENEKEEYFKIARKVYQESAAKEYIKEIRFVFPLDFAGSTNQDFNDEKIGIIIKLGAHLVDVKSTYKKYGEEFIKSQYKKFEGVFAHELVHAKDIADICNSIGVKAYKSISDNMLTQIALQTILEYSACKETAVKYNSYDSIEDLNRAASNMNMIIDKAMAVMKGINDEKCKQYFSEAMYLLSYAIATKCAFADAANDEDEYLSLEGNTCCKVFTKRYVERLKKLLREYYEIFPLDVHALEELGYKMVHSIFEVMGIKEPEIEFIIESLI